MAHTYNSAESNEAFWVQCPEGATKMTIRYQNLSSGFDGPTVLFSSWPQVNGGAWSQAAQAIYLSHDTFMHGKPDGSAGYIQAYGWGNPGGFQPYRDANPSVLASDSYLDIEITINANDFTVKLSVNGESAFQENTVAHDGSMNLWGGETTRKVQLFYNPNETSHNGSNVHQLEIDTLGQANSNFNATYPIYVSFGDVTPGSGTYAAALSGGGGGGGGDAGAAGDPFITPMFE